MRRTIIVTDLTRFKNPDIVCVAGTDRVNGECIRLMPYLKTAACQKLNILPGVILDGRFTPSHDRKGPHQEDYSHTGLRVEGSCSSAEFRTALKQGLVDSVEAGFEIALQDGQKCIPFGHTTNRSIITISTSPQAITIVENTFQPEKVKLNFTDESGREFRFIPITDLGFRDYAVDHHVQYQLNDLNRWIRSQDEVLLRLGLGRRFQPQDGPDGYWLQANGIYTFPEYHRAIRRYS